MKKTIGLLSCILVFGFSTQAQAVNCMDGTVTADGRGNFDACIGAFDGNEGAMDGAVLLSEINTGVFGGITNWTFDAKYDVDSNAIDAGLNTLNFDITGSGSSGTWSITPETDIPLVLSLKSSTHWSAYYFEGGILTSGGTWNTNGVSLNKKGIPQGLSHGTISFFTIDGGGCQPGDPGCGGTTATPEPGTMFLMGSGLAGLSFWRWKKGAKSEA